MPFIGNTPDVNFTSFAKQDLTGVTGSPVKRGFTLTHAVANANEIEVFVNNVRQEPTEAYTVNGTGLTMTGDVETSDDFYIIYLGKAIQTTVPPDGSVSTAKIASSAVDLTSKVTGVLPVGNSQTNTPAFQARYPLDFTFPDNIETKVTGFNVELDTNNNFASDRFTPTVAGKYFVSISGNMGGVNGYTMYNGNINLKKNGTVITKSQGQGHVTYRSNRYPLCTTAIVDMNGSTDYLEMFVYLNTQDSANGRLSDSSASFSAFKLIGA